MRARLPRVVVRRIPARTSAQRPGHSEQRSAAIEAERDSAAHLGFALPEERRDDLGAPLPVDGLHRSRSHSRGLAAGVVWTEPIGVDLECKLPHNPDSRRTGLSADEATLLGSADDPTFLRAWTAKEAVVKLHGHGLAGLAHARITATPSDRRLVVHYRDEDHPVHTYRIEGWSLAVALVPGCDLVPDIAIEAPQESAG